MRTTLYKTDKVEEMYGGKCQTRQVDDADAAGMHVAYELGFRTADEIISGKSKAPAKPTKKEIDEHNAAVKENNENGGNNERDRLRSILQARGVEYHPAHGVKSLRKLVQESGGDVARSPEPEAGNTLLP